MILKNNLKLILKKMKHYFLTNYHNVYDDKLFELYKKNYKNDKDFTPEYRYNTILNYSDIWFHLINENDEIIACCSVLVNKNCYQIDDVFVEEQFRGNNYAILLLMNVLFVFNDSKQKIILFTSEDNIPAIKTYERLFGSPKKNGKDLVFSFN